MGTADKFSGKTDFNMDFTVSGSWAQDQRR